METSIVGVGVGITDRFRTVVEDKAARIEHLAPRAQRVDIKITHRAYHNGRVEDDTVELTLTGKAGETEAKLARSEALVPRPALIGEGAFAIRAAKREGARVTVEVAAPAGVAVDLFAEGPTAEWALPVPAPVAGGQRFTFELDGLPPNTKPDGATLTLTAVAGEQAIEVPYRLDSPN